MSDRIIEDVPLTKKWLADVIEKKLGVRPNIGTNSTLENAEMGYMSMIRKVALSFGDEHEEKHGKLPKNVVLKIANSSKGSGVLENAGGDVSDSRDADAIEQYMHDTECDYYNMFSKLETKPLRVPVIYATEKTKERTTEVPVIVMEMFEDCKVHDLIDGFNEQQLYKIVDEIIKLHVFSLSTEQWKDIVPDPTLAEMLSNFHVMVRAIADKLSEQPGLDIIKVYVKNTFDKDMKFLEKYADDYIQEKRTSVLCHGDLWSPQILWDKNDDIAGIIDWQICHRGGPMEDIHHVLSTCTSVENRKRLEKPLLDYYFDKLSIGLESKAVKNPWTRQDIDDEYTHAMLHAAALTIFANGFWSNSPVLQTDGKPDPIRIGESFARCKSYMEDVVKSLNFN